MDSLLCQVATTQQPQGSNVPLFVLLLMNHRWFGGVSLGFNARAESRLPRTRVVNAAASYPQPLLMQLDTDV